MQIGKLTNKELDEIILSNIKPFRDDVVLRPGIGIDCGGVKIGGEICMLSSDPITAASKDAGKLAVHVSCNDVAATGAEPIAMLVTMLIPPESTIEKIRELFEQMQMTAKELNVEIIGGHTEITDSVNKIVICSTVLGKAKEQKYLSAAGAQVGDSIVLTKFAAMEGTAIIASDLENEAKKALTDEELKRCRSLADRISVVKEGLIAAEIGASAMHDVTEGGVLQAVWELCRASECGAVINLDKIPILDETKKLCSALNIDPLRLISSGCMIISIKDGQNCVNEMHKNGIPASIVGKIKEGNIITVSDGNISPLIPQERDEIYKIIK
ncbi:MAG: AIR synthase family protein [Clostridia bacterium]|nr:AIR synthase family protein [Clostridia bacterium]